MARERVALVLDDSEDYQRILLRLLKPAGYKVLQARSAEEAMVALQDRVPDVALVDWNLPGDSGIEFSRKVRSEPRLNRMILVMLTVNARPEDQVKGLREGGVNAFMTKPFDADELLARLDVLIARREALGRTA